MGIFQRKIKKEFVSFQDKIVFKKEKEIAACLEIFFKNLNARDEALLSVLDSRATIESRLFGGVATAEQFMSSLRSNSDWDLIAFEEVVIRPEGALATAYGYLSVLLKSGILRSRAYVFGLKHQDSQWKICSGRYVNS